MARTRTVASLLVCCALLGAVFVVGLPGSRRSHGPCGLPLLFRVTPVASYLKGFAAEVPAGLAEHPLALDLCRLFDRSPADGGALLEEGLLRLTFDGPTPSYLLRSCAAFLAPAVALVDREAPDVGDGLPLRAIGGLGAVGLELLRVSAENSARFPAEFQRALTDLVLTLNRTAPLFSRPGAAELRRWRDLFSTADGAALTVAEAGPLDDADRRQALLALADLADCLTRTLPALEAAVGAPFVRTLRTLPDGEGVPRNLVLAAEVDAGIVLIGGPGTTVLPLGGVALAIDLGGDDRWFGAVSMADLELEPPAARIAIDLDGHDRYRGEGLSLGAAAYGVAALVDVAGDDVYEATELEFGAALFGAALHIDLEGRDRYRCDRAGLGFGLMGLGVLYDAGDDDRYQCSFAGQGVGVTGGAGLLIDHWGDDLYLALSGSELPDPGEARALSLGAAFSCVADAPAGLGLLFDRRGEDVYRAASEVLGFAAEFGLGCVLDGGGDDLYSSGHRSLGSSRSGGVGILRDLAGDDEYLSRTRSQGFGAGGAGLFIDDDGQDRNLALKPSWGAGEDGGAGVFADVAATR